MSTSTSQPTQTWWDSVQLRDVAAGTLMVMLVLSGFAMSLALRGVFIAAFLGILLGTALRPLMEFLRRITKSRVVATSISVALLVLFVASIIVALLPLMFEQSSALIRALPGFYEVIRQELLGSSLRLPRLIGAQLPTTLVMGDPQGSEELTTQSLDMLPTLGRSTYIGIGTIVITYYWLLFYDRTLAGLLLLLPMERRDAVRDLWHQIEERIGAFVRGQALLALATGGLSLVGYWLVGLPYAGLMALIAALLELIPFIGPFIAMAVATLIGFSISPAVAAGALVVGILIQQAENIFLAPTIMEKAVGISPVVTMLAFVGFAALFGPIGGFLSIPLAAALQVLFAAWMSARNQYTDTDGGRSTIDRLRYQIQDLRNDVTDHLRHKEADAQSVNDQVEEDLEAVLIELQSLLEQKNENDLAENGQRTH
jgi:predicted PurR-regulated permease PerM